MRLGEGARAILCFGANLRQRDALARLVAAAQQVQPLDALLDSQDRRLLLPELGGRRVRLADYKLSGWCSPGHRKNALYEGGTERPKQVWAPAANEELCAAFRIVGAIQSRLFQEAEVHLDPARQLALQAPRVAIFVDTERRALQESAYKRL